MRSFFKTTHFDFFKDIIQALSLDFVRLFLRTIYMLNNVQKMEKANLSLRILSLRADNFIIEFIYRFFYRIEIFRDSFSIHLTQQY